MALQVEEAISKKELVEFIKFPFSLFKGNEFYVPPIIDFELSTLLKKKNPAFDHADAKYWVVKKEGKIVGRIAGIVIDQELEEKSLIRFGWVDFIDDREVSLALFEQVAEWGNELGAKKIHGPLGFTDLDFEGSLISGFDQLATQATIYNYPYYDTHYSALGFESAADWVEIRGPRPQVAPEKVARVAAIVSQRSKVKIKKFKRAKDILPYANGVFEVLNEAYTDLYGYHPLTEKQIKYYIDLYFGFVKKEFVCIVVNEDDDVIGVALCLPSLSKAFQKAKGKMFPFGFIHVLQAFRKSEMVDVFLIGIKPKYQRLGIHALIFTQLIETFNKYDVKYMGTGPMLESNRAVLGIWDDFLSGFDDITIKRRCYIKSI